MTSLAFPIRPILPAEKLPDTRYRKIKKKIDLLKEDAAQHPVRYLFLASAVAGVFMFARTMIREREGGFGHAVKEGVTEGAGSSIRVLRTLGSIYGAISTASMLDPGYLDLKAKHRNLTQKALDGNLSVMVGREEIIEELMGALTCADKPNALLVGPPGVGKTAIVEGLALRLSKGDLPPNLKGAVLIEVKASEFIGGGGLVGTAEKRIGRFIEDLGKLQNYIVFIDRIDALVNMRDDLKSALVGRGVRVISCTTEKEVKKIMEDRAFNRRFQRIEVEEPKGAMLMEIVYARTQELANFHQCEYKQGAVWAAIHRTTCLPGHYPDKALAVLDWSGVLVRIKKKPEKSVDGSLVYEAIKTTKGPRPETPSYIM